MEDNPLPVGIDLNCDAGESFGPWPMGDDEALIPLMTSVNIACGAHAGDPLVMRRTLLLAKRHNVSVGAHPGYPDLHGFGRRAIPMPPDEVEAWTLAQLGALDAMARGVGMVLRHVKPHGALYNMAADDEALSEAIVRAVRAFSPELVLVARAGSRMVLVARAGGLRVAEEAFGDRGYDAEGRLLPRAYPGALLHDPAAAATRAVTLLQTGALTTADGAVLHLHPQTLCFHSDTAGTAAIAVAVRAALLDAGMTVRPLYELAR
ncbi:MAG TPA: 5-oxoprolinase subunit PxpA [Ktedonobacterales bacterium]|nr:5-oxoprolinase subunit PxpA [Ktedonobacterales bacterium]